MRRTEHRQAIKQGDMAAQSAIHIPLRAESLPNIRLKSIVLCVAAALSAYPYLNANAQDLPTNPQVVGGAATITQSGNHQTVTQTTNRAIVNWGGFSIGANNSVNFIQPGSSSVILNRVIGNDPSSIFGSLTANGKVFLVNPNGIFFGAGSSIDTGGLVATTMSIRDNDFMSGYFNFERSGAGQVENAGLITIREGGYALLAADQVSNTAAGAINAPKGSVAMVSADRVTIETNQDGLVGFSVSGNAVREVASVDNAGLISADGGRIMLSARGAQELTGMVVNNSGTIRAQTVEEQDGAIILSGSSGATQSSGVLDASGSRGGNIQVTNEQGVAAVAGQLTATGSAGDGGRIVVAGQQTGLFANTNIDASGTQGGTVRVGGEYRGDAVEGITSQQTYVASSANIKADGTAGDGGSVVVWADDVTRYDGNISARGTGAGKGGDAEVSGKQILAFNGTADLSSESGEFGELLLDPDTINITANTTAGSGSLDTEFGNLPANQVLAAVANNGGNTISKGTLEAAAFNANVRLEASGLITLEDLGANNSLNMAQTGAGSFTLRSTTSGGITFANTTNSIITQGGSISLLAEGTGELRIGSLTSTGGAITLQSGGLATMAAINSGGGAINIDSGAALTTGSLTSANGNIDLDSVGNMTTGAISSGSGTVNASSGGTLTTGTVTTSNANVILASSGNMNINNVNSGSGTINLASSGNIHIRNIDTSQTLSLNSGGAITQQAATRIAANTVSIVNASTVNLTQSNFANNLNANVNGSSFAYKDANALTVNNVTVNNGAGNASLNIETGSTMTVAGNVAVTGTGNATNKSAAVMNLRATGGNIIQNAGTQITATDNGAFINNTSQETHFVQVTLKADNGGVVTRNVSANSTNGRAQVIVDGRIGVTATSGSITATAASQPGVSIFSKDGNITTTNATIRTTQTREVDGPQNSKANPNKVVENVGGISIDGGTLNLGRIESRSTAASGIALFGIATASRGNTTFNQLVNTNADAGVSASTTGTNALVSTAGVGLLQTKALALTGDRDKGFFRVKTDIESLTVLGGKAVDLDNTAHGAGVLTISALGRISDATTDPNTNTEIPETNKPVGGVRIQSQNIELLSLENRSDNSYLFDGTQTNNNIFYGGAVQQDLRLIANNITFIPGTIQTKATTFVQLRPLTDSRNMQLALANATIPANTTFYTGDQIVGLLNQFNPDSVMVLGGANAIDVYGGTNAYSGNITIGSSTALANQISLGDMTLRFITNGRVFNNFAANTNTPSTWIDGGLLSAPYSASVICGFGQSCIKNMTTNQIFIKDSLKQSDPGNTRDVVLQGTGSGQGGTEPTGNSATNTGGGGGDSGGGNSSGGGGGGSNSNDSGSGGSNAPSDNPGGGGNDTTTPDQSGTTQVTNNPGQGNGNPGGNPGGTTDPTTPGGTTNTGTPQDSSNPTGDTLAGGGSFSGNDGSTGNTGNTGGNTNTGGNNSGGGNTSNGDNNQNTGNNPSGGGTLSDGSTPGGNNNTQTGDAGNNNGFTGGGNNSNNGNTGTGSNNTNTAGTGGTGGTGGGTFSDGSGSTSGGTQVADGSGGSGGNSGGFTGGGANSSGSTGGGGSGSSGGGTFSDGSGSTSGGTQVVDGSSGSGSNSGGFTGGGSGSGAGSTGSGGTGNTGGGTFSDGSGTTPGGTQIADGSSSGSTGGSAGGSGGFSGGGSGASSTASTGGGSGSSGGGTFSDGSGTTSGGTQVAGGSNQGSGQSGSGQSSSSSSQGSGGTQGAGSQADAGGFSGGGSGTSGSQSAGSDSGGFAGGGSSSTASTSGTGGSSGGATFSDGSGSGASGGTMIADGGQTGGSQSTGQGAGSQGDSSSGQAGSDSGGFSGGASGASSGGSDDGSQTQTASNQQTGDSTTGDGGSVFGGGAAGGGSSDATQLAENTQEQTQDYPECGDEGQSVKQVSRAGQPNADIVQMKATGVRLRGDSGSLNQQRASCARATATN